MHIAGARRKCPRTVSGDGIRPVTAGRRERPDTGRVMTSAAKPSRARRRAPVSPRHALLAITSPRSGAWRHHGRGAVARIASSAAPCWI